MCMTERVKYIKETLLCAIESQLENLEEVDAAELGEVVDMIKDLEEAEYYCAVTKAMKEAEEYEEYGKMHYPVMYYGGRSASHEKEMGHMMEDPREGRSYKARRNYMESKETHQDKTAQMKELEKYAQELTQDMIEMVEDASPEERQYLSKKVTALANKITQLNTNV